MVKNEPVRYSGIWLPLLGAAVFLTLVASLACPPAAGAQGAPEVATVRGNVQRGDTGVPIAHASILVRETSATARTDDQGQFVLTGLTPGLYTLQISAYGCSERIVEVEVTSSLLADTGTISLEPMPRFLTEMVVTPSHYSLYREQPEPRSSMDREEVQRMPHFAEDIFRAARWLPGTSGEDLSSQMYVRGGEVDENLLLIDGLEIQEAFHLKELFSLVSVVDAEAVAGLDFMSGGFPVEYGNRMSGVIDITSSSPRDSRSTAGISTTHMGFLSEGLFAGGRGQWVISGRRTDLDMMIDWVDPDNNLEPMFYDAFGKVSYRLGDRTLVSATALWARDDVHYTEEDGYTEELLDSASTRWYGWLTSETAWSPRLSSRTILSTGSIDRERGGFIDYWYQSGDIDDSRTFDVLGLKQDWNLELSERHALKWGFDVQRMEATYDYFASSVVSDPLFIAGGEPRVSRRDFDLEPDGNAYAAYVADRFLVTEPLVVEVGLRWDRQTVTDEDQVSPRVNMAYSISPRTTLRAAWGHYYQPQRLDELQVSDGVTEFQPAQRAEHRLLALEHAFPRGIDVRVEAYQKLITDVRPHWENLLNPIEIFPELEADRVLVAPDRSEASGAEIMLRYTGGRRWSGWLSYCYAKVEDLIDGEWVPRSWDQRNTVNFSLNYRRGERWNFNLSAAYHSGWPTTAVYGEVITEPDGSRWVRAQVGPRNRARLDEYLRFDVRASRDFQLRRAQFSIFIEVANLFNRDNLERPESFDWQVDQQGNLRLSVDYESFMPMIPSIGVRWTL